MTRAKYNKNPKLMREQWILFFKQQTDQVALLLDALERAYETIGQLEEALKKKSDDKLEEELKKKCEVNVDEDEEEKRRALEENMNNRKTIMVFDSHIKTIKTRVLEEELGGQLFTGQFCWERRAYNSGEWPGARKPLQNLEAVLPNVLEEREYTDAILQASCNDITNLKGISKDKKLLFQMAEKSSLNTVRCAVSALANFPFLKNILIIPRSPRADDMLLSEVSEHGNKCLFSAIASTGLPSIKLGSSNSIPCQTRSEINDLFGDCARRDLIHMRGPKGRDLYTEAIRLAIQANSLGITT